MKKIWAKLLLLIVFAFYYCKTSIKRLFKEYFSWKTVVLFILVVLLIGSEVWVPMALGFIFDKTWLIGVGSSCWGFWLLPGTPFFPFCAALTIGIRKLQIRRKQQKERLALRY